MSVMSYLTLHGLCAAGNVRSYNDQFEIIDTEEITVSDFEGRPVYVSVEDVRHNLAQWSRAPSSNIRDKVIATMLDENKIPGRNITWAAVLQRGL